MTTAPMWVLIGFSGTPGRYILGGMPKGGSNALRLKAWEPSEAQIQAGVLQALAAHPRVAWAHRFNTGAAVNEHKGRRHFVRFAFPGCADILGQTTDGRFLAIECKSRTGRLTADQKAFLDRVASAGGVSGVARSVDDVWIILGGTDAKPLREKEDDHDPAHGDGHEEAQGVSA